jgi:hypothetical protein
MLSRYTLDAVKTKTHLLTVRFDFDVYAAYALAAEVHGHEDLSEYVRKQARASIAEAREVVGGSKFTALVEVKKQEIEARSNLVRERGQKRKGGGKPPKTTGSVIAGSLHDDDHRAPGGRGINATARVGNKIIRSRMTPSPEENAQQASQALKRRSGRKR